MAVDFATGGTDTLAFVRSYNSHDTRQTAFGSKWGHNFEARLDIVDADTIQAERPDGRVLKFTKTGSTWQPDSDVVLTLVASGSNWVVTDADDNSETYDSAGRLISVASRRGYTQTLAHDANGNLETVSDSYGRQLTFGHNAAGRLVTMTTPNGETYHYAYDNAFISDEMEPNRLHHVVFPDDTLLDLTDNSRVTYVYERVDAPYFLTGILDENGERFATFEYDSDLRATLSKHAGDTQSFSVVYNADGSRSVTSPLGTVGTYSYVTIEGAPKLSGVALAATADTPAMSTSITYDANGFVGSKTDRKGNVTNYVNDARGLETSRTEAVGTPEERTITTTWHPTLRLPDVVTEPGRTADFDYDAQGRLTTVTITDTTSHTLPYSTNGEVRVWSYTYSATGQVLTVDGPRTDVTDVTTFEYDAQGNRERIIDALGHTTHVTAFDGRGLPLTVLDSNGTETELSYNPRGWLTARRIKHASGDAVTAFDYDAVGQLLTITRPDGTRLHYEYDAARRLEAVRNDLGERIEYSLDAMGNRTAETVKSATGDIKRTQSRIFDSLGRLLQSIGAAGQTWTYAYDDNDNLETITDPAAVPGVTQRAFDALNRLVQVTDPALGMAGYGYDARDNLIAVTDQRTLTTTYVHNAFGDVIQIDSPDTGVTVYLVDPAGNVTRMTDARGVVTEFTHDALDRVLTKSFPADATQNVTYGYDDTAGGNHGIGRLTSAIDPSGSAAYRYDHRGNLVEEARTIGATSFTTGYAYDLADNLVKVTYPSGRIVNYDRDDLGRVAGVTTQESAAAVPVTIAGDITYLPFGPMESFTFGNGLTVAYAYDQDYRLKDIDTGDGVTAVQDLTIGYDGRDNITAITDNLDATRDQGFGYDALSRLTSASGPYGDIAYTYDAVGNRETRDVTVDSVTTNEVYSYALDSNRLLSVDVGGTLRSLTHGLSGNITADDRGADPDLGFDYDLDDRLVRVNRGGLPLKEYLYNAGGERVVKQAPGGFDPEYFHYDRSGRLLAESDGTGAWPRSYVYLNGLLIAQVEPGSGGGTPIDVILDNGAAGTTPSGTWESSTAGQGFEGADHAVRPAPPMPPLGGQTIDNGDPAFASVGDCASSTANPGFEGSDYLTCSAGSGHDYLRLVPLPLVNPDAETGDISGWTLTLGQFQTSTMEPDPIQGSYFFFGGTVAKSVMHQDVALPAATWGDVDSGGWQARLVWQQSSWVQRDRGSAAFIFLDAANQQIGPRRESTRAAPSTSWEQREIRVFVPPLTRSIRLELTSQRSAGTSNDGNLDAFELNLVQPSGTGLRQSLLLVNGNAEAGTMAGWTPETGEFFAVGTDPVPIDGAYYFYAGDVASSVVYQDLSLPSDQFAAIDAGERMAEVSWLQASWDGDDQGAVILEFLDAAALPVAAAAQSELLSASYWWEERSFQAAIPAGTRTLRVKLRGERSYGTSNDAYFDQVRVNLLLDGSPPSPPPPQVASWSFQVPTSEAYEVYAKWPEAQAHASNATYSLRHPGGTWTVTQ
ncbi:MAG: DUF6531 domain-containing protein, partial [Kiloniellales bacterium]|nr:DUF6531 domain-containing protein [Kiloniellales bacterium]